MPGSEQLLSELPWLTHGRSQLKVVAPAGGVYRCKDGEAGGRTAVGMLFAQHLTCCSTALSAATCCVSCTMPLLLLRYNTMLVFISAHTLEIQGLA